MMKFNLLTVYVLLKLCSAAECTAFYHVKIPTVIRIMKYHFLTVYVMLKACSATSSKILLKHILEPSIVKSHLLTASGMQEYVSTCSIYSNGIP
jgi:hypothetical protein